MNETEMRLDPLTQNWTVFSPSRAARPPAGLRNHSHNGLSPFTAGKEELAPHALLTAAGVESDGWQVRVVPNRAPALRVEGDTARHGDGFYDRTGGVGAHEVIIEDPGDRTLEELSLPELALVINAWKARMLDLSRDPRMRAFFVLKNVGEAAGATASHAVSQLVAMAVVPEPLKRKLRVARRFYEEKKRSIFDDILRDEVRVGKRLVYENNGFAVFCPYAAKVPFEQVIYPKRQCADFHGISDQETAQLADALRVSLGKMNVALDHPAYNLTLCTAPTPTTRRDHWHTLQEDFRWHIEILPRIYPVSGFELATGCNLNPVLPEEAAGVLRGIEL